MKPLPDSDGFRVVINDPIVGLLHQAREIAEVLGANPEDARVFVPDPQASMNRTVDNLPKRQFIQARRLVQALETQNLWLDPGCTIPATIDDGPSQFRAFVNAVEARSQREKANI